MTFDVKDSPKVEVLDRVVMEGRVWVVWAVEPVDGAQRLFVRPLRRGER